jgi:hypothetical protein
VPGDEAEDDPDPWDYWDGCSPVAGSMVVAYHEGNTSGEKKHEYVDELHRTMNTDSSGTTTPTDIDDGFNNFDIGINSYSGKNVSVSTHPNLPIREIDDGQPFLFSVTDGGSPDDKSGNYDDHTMTVVGYDEGGDELVVHDTWDYTDHHLDWGSWRAALYTTVRVE